MYKAQLGFLPTAECADLDFADSVLSGDACFDNKFPSSLWSLSNCSHKHEVQIFSVSTLPSTTVLLITILDSSFSLQYLHTMKQKV